MINLLKLTLIAATLLLLATTCYCQSDMPIGDSRIESLQQPNAPDTAKQELSHWALCFDFLGSVFIFGTFVEYRPEEMITFRVGTVVPAQIGTSWNAGVFFSIPTGAGYNLNIGTDVAYYFRGISLGSATSAEGSRAGKPIGSVFAEIRKQPYSSGFIWDIQVCWWYSTLPATFLFVGFTLGHQF